MSQFTYDYYSIGVPGDCADTVEALAEIAINEARERARLYVMPATWSAELESGELGDFEVYFKVRRKRFAKPRLGLIPVPVRGGL